MLASVALLATIGTVSAKDKPTKVDVEVFAGPSCDGSKGQTKKVKEGKCKTFDPFRSYHYKQHEGFGYNKTEKTCSFQLYFNKKCNGTPFVADTNPDLSGAYSKCDDNADADAIKSGQAGSVVFRSFKLVCDNVVPESTSSPPPAPVTMTSFVNPNPASTVLVVSASTSSGSTSEEDVPTTFSVPTVVQTTIIQSPASTSYVTPVTVHSTIVSSPSPVTILLSTASSVSVVVETPSVEDPTTIIVPQTATVTMAATATAKRMMHARDVTRNATVTLDPIPVTIKDDGKDAKASVSFSDKEYAHVMGELADQMGDWVADMNEDLEEAEADMKSKKDN